MMEFSAQVAALVAYGLLLLAGAAHLSRPRKTAAELAGQRVWPRPAVPAVVIMLITTELVVGGTGLAAVLAERPAWPLAAARAAAAALYLAFTGYGAVLLRWRPQAPCGCSGRPQPVSGWTVVRSAVLLGCAAAAYIPADALSAYADAPVHLLLAVLASLAFGVLVWELPAAMDQPAGRPS